MGRGSDRGRRRAHDRLAGLPGVRPIRRPVTPDRGEFDLYYVRTGRKSRHPLVVIPGGPGMASIGHYQGLRRRAVAAGLDVIMIEHRGVGLSRRDDSGTDLPPDALTIEAVVDDVAAVLDDARVQRAVVYGTSYGSYLAAGVGARHPTRVQAMVLDSPLLNGDDIEIVRRALRGLLWEGTDPLAAKVRALDAQTAMTPADAELAATVYGLGGPTLLASHLDLLLDGRRMVWTAMRHELLRLRAATFSVFHPALCDHLRQHDDLSLRQRPLQRHYIVSKVFNDFLGSGPFTLQDGDADCAFT